MNGLVLAWELPSEFRAYSALHALTAGACFMLMAAACVLGWRVRGTHEERRGRYFVGILGFAAMVGYHTNYMRPSRFNIRVSLPLQVCDIAGLVAVAALFFENRWLRTIVYYMGLVLCSQAFFQPTLTEGPAEISFWCFWVLHLLIVGTAVYCIVVLGYRPGWRDYWFAVAVGAGYALVMVPVDWAWDLNYGFIGPGKPRTASMIDMLGPWPLRVVWIGLISFSGFAVATAVWPKNRRRAAGSVTIGQPI